MLETMADLTLEHRHSLSDSDARARIHALGEYLQNKYGLSVTWDGDRATVRGRYMVVAIEGSVTVSPGVVVFRSKDPGMLWRSKAKSYLAGKLDQYLDPGTPVEALPRG